ncbi:hypothetical protein PCE1_000990 [Barthelona sp. PCE]
MQEIKGNIDQLSPEEQFDRDLLFLESLTQQQFVDVLYSSGKLQQKKVQNYLKYLQYLEKPPHLAIVLERLKNGSIIADADETYVDFFTRLNQSAKRY